MEKFLQFIHSNSTAVSALYRSHSDNSL